MDKQTLIIEFAKVFQQHANKPTSWVDTKRGIEGIVDYIESLPSGTRIGDKVIEDIVRRPGFKNYRGLTDTEYVVATKDGLYIGDTSSKQFMRLDVIGGDGCKISTETMQPPKDEQQA